MSNRKKEKDRDLVLCLRVKLKSGCKLQPKKFLGAANPYCKVWIGPKGMLEAPEKGYYYSTVAENTINPFWGNPSLSKPDINDLTKQLYKKVELSSQFLLFIWYHQKIIFK